MYDLHGRCFAFFFQKNCEVSFSNKLADISST
jgi:hypothetical protein